MLKTILTACTWASAWALTTVTVRAGVPAPPPAAENDSGNEGLLLLVLVGAVIFAAAKGKAKPVEEAAPEIVDAEEGAGMGKY